MTTYIDFVPSQSAPFQFQPTLDGQVYTGIVTWNLFGQRYYLNLYTLGGVLVFNQALVGSTVGVALASLTWGASTGAGTVTATTEEPHGYTVGQTVDLTVSGATPSGYNGLFECLITGASTFTYQLTADPGAATVNGNVNYDIDLCAGYDNVAGTPFASTLVYREANMQFEVSP